MKITHHPIRGDSFFFFFNKFIYLFIYFCCVGSSFLCEGFLQLRQAGATLHRGARASRCGARLQTRRLSSCGSRAQLVCSMWDRPRPGLEPVSPESAGRLSTTAPPGKPQGLLLIDVQKWKLVPDLISGVIIFKVIYSTF